MKARVEAGHLGQIGPQRSQAVDGAKALRVVHGSQVGQGVEPGVGSIVEEDGLDERRATVDHSVPGRIEVGVLSTKAPRTAPISAGAGAEDRSQPPARLRRPTGAASAAGSGVDDENVHPPTLPDGAPDSGV